MFSYVPLIVFVAASTVSTVQGGTVPNPLTGLFTNDESKTEWSGTPRASPSIKCREDQWRCNDGSCIWFDKRCDGVKDCTDGSDERHAVCRKNDCFPNLFRCTYGACVDGGSRCNGTPQCADGSDELLPECRNETTVVEGKFTCNNGAQISAAELCDGASNCADGSDETLAACAGRKCASYLFQCAYGACVDAGAECDANRVWHCADGSDEFDDLCNRAPALQTTAVPPNGSKRCQIPPNPANGVITTERTRNYKMEQNRTEEYLKMSVSCLPPYRPYGDVKLTCHDGQWNGTVAECKLSCKVYSHPSVTYFCLDVATGEERKCHGHVPDGTVIRPQCNTHYHHKGELPPMTCLNYEWDRISTCEHPPKECDATSDAVELYGKGKNLTISINDSIFVKISGPEYTVAVANASETFVTVSSNLQKSAKSAIDELVEGHGSGLDIRTPEFRTSPRHERESPVVRKKFFVPRVIRV